MAHDAARTRVAGVTRSQLSHPDGEYVEISREVGAGTSIVTASFEAIHSGCGRAPLGRNMTDPLPDSPP